MWVIVKLEYLRLIVFYRVCIVLAWGRCGLGCLRLSWFHGLHGRKGFIVCGSFLGVLLFSYALRWVGLDPPGIYWFVVWTHGVLFRMADVGCCRCIVRTVECKVGGTEEELLFIIQNSEYLL